VIRTDDLFLGAFALSRGGELSGVEVEGVNGRAVAFFHIDGGDEEGTEREYYHGPVAVNLPLFKMTVQRLKNAAFEEIRKQERNNDQRYQSPSRFRGRR
jgi:hypothetical protein